jgi:hypothetical protein
VKQENDMVRTFAKIGAIAALLMASGAAYADDPTGLLLRWRGEVPTYSQGPAGVSYYGPCGPGTQSQAFPNAQGYRCVPIGQ